MHRIIINIISILIFTLSAQLLAAQNNDLLKNDSLINSLFESRPQKALELAKENYSRAESAKIDSYAKARIFSTLAKAYHINSDYINALKYRLTAIDIFEEINADKELIESYSLLGGIFYNIGEYDKTIKYTQHALDIANKFNYDNYKPLLYNNLAGAYIKINKFSEALKYAYKVVSIAEQQRDLKDKFYGLSVLGEIYLHKNNCDSARYYFDKVLKLNYTEEVVTGYMKTFMALNVAEMEWCAKDTTKSIAEAKKAYRLANLNKLPVLQKDASQLLSIAYEAKDNNDSSFFYRQQAVMLQDSLWSREKESQLNRVIINHRENELNTQKEATAKQKQLTLYSIIVGLIVFAVFVIFIFSYQKISRLNNQLQQQKNEMQKLHRFKDKVFSTVVHDFKTPMNSLENMLRLIISGHISSEESEELATKMLEQVRYSKSTINNLIVWVKKQMDGFDISEKNISLEEILNETRAFHLHLAEIKNIKINIETEPNATLKTDYEVLLVVLNNLVSNAIKFTDKGGQVTLKAKSAKNTTQITVEDDGIGFDQEILDNLFTVSKPTSYGTSLEKGTGLGLIICKELIDKLGGTIEVESAKREGSKITLTFQK